MSSTRKSNKLERSALWTRIEAEFQNRSTTTARELSNRPIPMATESEAQKEDAIVKGFDIENRKENNEDISAARSFLSDVNTAMEIDQWTLKTSILGMKSTITDRTCEDTEVSQWSLKMNDCDHGRSYSASSCSYHFGNQRCCECPNCLELIVESTSWKPEKLRIFHCNDCGGTTIREIRSLYIDGRPERSYSMNPMQHEWHCFHCGFSDSGTVSSHKNTNLLDAKNLDSHEQTISGTSVLTSVSNLCKHPIPSCSHKHSLPIRSDSTQCKYSKKCNENLEKHAKNDKCDCLVINESQIGSSFMQKSKIEMGTIKWVTDQETSIIKSTNVATTMASLKASPTRKNSLPHLMSAEKSENLQMTAQKTQPKMKLLRTAKQATDSVQIITCKDEMESNEQMGSEKSLDSEILLTPTAEVTVPQRDMKYNMGAGRLFSIDPSQTALELKCEMMEINKESLKTARQISETDLSKVRAEYTALSESNIDLKTAAEKTTTFFVGMTDHTAKYDDRYVVMNVVKRISGENDAVHNSSINSDDISTAKSTFVDITSLSSTIDHFPNSNLSMVDLKAGRPDDRKFDIRTNTTKSPGLCATPQPTAGNSAGCIPASYHYRTPTHTELNISSQQTPPYMAPTISSTMKMKQIIKQRTSSESPMWSSRRPHSVSEGLHTAASFTPSRNRGSHRSRLRLWQQTTWQPLPKICYKKCFADNLPEAELLTKDCDMGNKLNHQNLRRTLLQPVARRSSHRGGLYHNYLKQRYWDRITSKYDKISRDERFMKQDQQRTAALAPTDVQNLEQTELQLSPRKSCQEKTSRFCFDSDHSQQQDQVDDDASALDLCTAQVKTPRGWQRTFSHVPCKISRFDRFVPQFVEAVSAQLWMTEAPLRQSPSKTAGYNIWQRIASNSSQKISRLNRFWKQEIRDMKSQCISQLEQSADQFILTESRMLRGLIWKRTVFKSAQKIPRLDRFPVANNSVTDTSQGSFFEREVSLDFFVTQSPLRSVTSPNPSQRVLSYEQAKLAVPLREASSESSRSSLHTVQLQSLKTLFTESLSSEELSEKHSNFTDKPVRRATISEFLKKNVPLSLCTSETQSSEGSILPGIIFYDESLWKRSKSILQRTSRFERFQERTTKSFGAPARGASRFDRYQKNTLSILSTPRANSSFASILPDTSSAERSLSERSKSILSRKFSRQSCASPSPGYFTPPPCIWNRLTVESTKKSSRMERFQNSASLDLCTAQNRSSSLSLFSDISLIASSKQIKAVPSKNCYRYYPGQGVTTDTSDSYQKEKMLDRNSRFKRFQKNFSPNLYTAQSTSSQNSSTEKQTEQGVPHKNSCHKHFKTDHISSEVMGRVNGPYEDHSLCNGSPIYSSLTAQHRSSGQALTCHSPDSIDSCRNMYLTYSTTQTVDSDRNKDLKQKIKYEEQFENPTAISLNMFNGIRDGKSSELWNGTTTQQIREISHLDRIEGQHFGVRTLSAEKKLSRSQLLVDGNTSATKDLSFNDDVLRRTKPKDSGEVQEGIVKETGSHTASIQLQGTNSERTAPGDIVSSNREIHIALQTKFQPMKLCLNGITASEEVCIQRIVVNGNEIYHRELDNNNCKQLLRNKSA